MAQTSLDLFEWRKRVLGWSRSFNLKLGETVSCDVRLQSKGTSGWGIG